MGVFQFSWGSSAPLCPLSVFGPPLSPERSWKSGNLPYLLCNTYGLNFIKIGCIWIFMGVFCPPLRLLTINKRSWKSGSLPYLVCNTYGLNFIKIGHIWIFMGVFCPSLRLLTVNKRSWNFGNIAYALCNIYGLNFVEIGCISIFMGIFCPPCAPPLSWSKWI